MMNKIRYDYIDLSKAIAIFLMVLLHTTFAYYRLSECVGAFHMAIFFFIAGMFAKGPDVPVKVILKKSWMQLMVPYFIFSICAFSSCWISPYLHPEIYVGFHGFADIYKGAFIGMLLMQDRVTLYSFMPCGPLWFLPALFLCRVFFMFWAKASRKPYCRLFIIGVLAGAVYYRISIFSLSPAAVSFPFVLLGHYAKGFVFSNDPLCKPRTGIYVYLATSLLAFVCVYLLKGHGICFDGASYAGNICIAYLRGAVGLVGLLALGMAVCKIPFRRLTQHGVAVGKATIAVLGLHGYFIILFKVIYVLSGHAVARVTLWYAVPVSLVTVFVCTVIYQKILVKYFPIAVGKSKES